MTPTDDSQCVPVKLRRAQSAAAARLLQLLASALAHRFEHAERQRRNDQRDAGELDELDRDVETERNRAVPRLVLVARRVAVGRLAGGRRHPRHVAAAESDGAQPTAGRHQRDAGRRHRTPIVDRKANGDEPACARSRWTVPHGGKHVVRLLCEDYTICLASL